MVMIFILQVINEMTFFELTRAIFANKWWIWNRMILSNKNKKKYIFPDDWKLNWEIYEAGLCILIRSLLFDFWISSFCDKGHLAVKSNPPHFQVLSKVWLRTFCSRLHNLTFHIETHFSFDGTVMSFIFSVEGDVLSIHP